MELLKEAEKTHMLHSEFLSYGIEARGFVNQLANGTGHSKLKNKSEKRKGCPMNGMMDEGKAHLIPPRGPA